jgi:hypothetical protein
MTPKLTTSQLDLLKNALRRPNRQIYTYGVQNRTIEALSIGGFIKRSTRLTDAERADSESRLVNALRNMRRILAENGDNTLAMNGAPWGELRDWFRGAIHERANLDDTIWVLTCLGAEAVQKHANSDQITSEVAK